MRNRLQYVVNDTNVARYRHTVNDSELLRMVQAVDTEYIDRLKEGTDSIAIGKRQYQYIDSLISVKVRYNTPLYNKIMDADGILILEHKMWVDEQQEDGTTKKKLKTVLDGNGNPVEEHFKRIIVGSGHNRSKKALFIRKDLFDKINKILLGTIDEYKEMNNYPLYKKGYAKWNSYYGLASTDSKVVSYVPKIVVVKDFKREVSDIFDVVVQTKKNNPDWKVGDDEKNKYIKTYSVNNNVNKPYEIMPFDGAGLVSVECAKQWAKELDIKNEHGKEYIPAAFQIRVIPGIKGNLYTFDIEEFAKLNGGIIIDNKGRKHNCFEEKVDIILTESQVKFLSLFDDDIELWRKGFEKTVIFEDGTQYKRTFNISEYSEDVTDVKHRMLTAYQHWLTIENEEQERTSVIADTVGMIKKISTDPMEFLKYRSCTDDKEQGSKIEWKRIPPYYRAAYYASEENKPIIMSDSFFISKVKEDIEGTKNRALSGKLYLKGNYQVLTPDIYALAQFAFGKRGNEVTGLLRSEEIYSNWWDITNLDRKYNDTKLALIRNPHIYMEARVAKMVTLNTDNLYRYIEIMKWYKYQTTGIVTDSFSTIPLALGTADFDGDHIATTDCREYVKAVERARDSKKGNTVDLECVDMTKESKNVEPANISDIKKLMAFDVLGYNNDIGTVIDKVTTLWGIKQTDDNIEQIRNYIKIMDIVGQLTIDAAKTGEFEAVPKDIVDFLNGKSGNNKTILKPYFMKYLKKNDRKRKKESRALENADIFFDGECDIKDKQELFSDEDVNLNLMCHAIEREIADIEVTFSDEGFSVEKFISIFCTDKPCVTSELYINIRDKLKELSKQHSEIYVCFKDSTSGEDREEKISHYRYFYLCAREELLCVCKLSEEKSLNKVLNCIVYVSYTDKDLIDDDNVRSILWNCFGEELVERAKQNYTDKEIVLAGIDDKVKKITELKKKTLSKYLEERPISIRELEQADKEYCPIIVRDEDIKMIQSIISESNLEEHKIHIKYKDTLIKLYSVLMVLSKRLEVDRPVGKTNKITHCILSMKIKEGSNNCLNYANIAKLCGVGDYQRKHLKERLKELNTLGAITIYKNELSDISIRVNYEKIEEFENAESLVAKDDYVSACTKILSLLKVA